MAPSITAERALLKAFLAWKAFLLSIVLASSFFSSYDSSTSLALDLGPDHAPDSPPLPSSLADAIATRLTRWDAIYFTAIAHRGYLYEQEWAFGPGLPYFVSKVLLPLTSALGLRLPRTRKTAALASIAAANASHLAAVLLLYALVCRVFPRRRNLALTAGLLHVISPAGMFLSAPYAESSFAALSFAGCLIYVAPDLVPAPASIQRGLSLVISGALFGLATACRTNGMLNGVVFAVELLSLLYGVLTERRGSALTRLCGALPLLVPTVVGGILVASGSVIPQALAYARYCSGASDPRPWCGNLVPSIYAFVQEHYWYVPPGHPASWGSHAVADSTRNTGFLRYWTLPNLPLFLLAFPMLTILLASSSTVIPQVLPSLSTLPARLLLSMSIAQALLALLTITSYHVQIVTRLASGYPVWYIWLAAALSPAKAEGPGGAGGKGGGHGDKAGAGGEVGDERVLRPGLSGGRYGRGIVKYMVLYATVQGVLFCCFLPPA